MTPEGIEVAVSYPAYSRLIVENYHRFRWYPDMDYYKCGVCGLEVTTQEVAHGPDPLDCAMGVMLEMVDGAD